MVPYSSSVPTCRKRPTPVRLAASARVATPRVLVRTAASGSTIERSTWVSAGQQLQQQLQVADVALHEGVAGLAVQVGQAGQVAGVGQLVEVGDLRVRVGGEQVADVVGADEAG